MRQFARPEFLVFQCGVSSGIAVTTYLVGVEYQLFLARDYGVLPRKDWKSLTVETIEIRRMLCGLRRRILGNDDRDEP